MSKTTRSHRNEVLCFALKRKAGVHGKSRGASRQAAKRALRHSLRDG